MFLKKLGTITAGLMLTTALIGCGNQTGKSSTNEVKIQPAAGVKTKIDSANLSISDPDLKKIAQIALASREGYELTESLTTDIGPRMAGSRAEANARRWAVKKFRELGYNNIKNEPFETEAWSRGVNTALLTSPSKQTLFVTALGGSVATPARGISAPVAYFESFEALKEAPLGSLDGKIAYITGKMERARDGAGYGPANQKRRSGASEAGKRGALAVLIRSVGTDSHRFPHTGQMRYDPAIKPIPIGALSAPDADQLDRMFAKGDEVKITLKLATRSLGVKKSGNVYADIPGTERPDEIVLIGAHLDSWDLGTGAIDDGAGVGIVMAAGKVLKDAGLAPKRTIRVVLFGAEENGLTGAFAFAEKHKDSLGNIVMATESDFGAERIYGLQGGASAASQAAARKLAPSFEALGISYVEGQSNGGPDIGPMAAQGVPTMRLNQDGTDYFDLHHTPDDTFDKIDPDAMAQNVAAYAMFIWQIANSDETYR